MTLQERTTRTDRADFLLSWDRLGFRVLLFGGLAVFWIFQARMLNQSWAQAIRGELVGLLPWVFLASIVLAMSRRVRLGRFRLGGFLALHLLGMALVLIPYWLMQRGIVIAWAVGTAGWDAAYLQALKPNRQNLFLALQNVPLTYIMILLGAEAMNHAQARREGEVQAELLGGQLAEARLSLLQRQLNPHFLFNALQAVSTLLHRDPMDADRVLMRLSGLLRVMLDEASGQTLSLRTELELTRRYLEIEQVRFADRLSVTWEVDGALLEVQVPSLIVLPFVENAIRHGLSPKVGPGHLNIRAASEGASLRLDVEDDGLGTTLPLRPGVGISNTRERLAAMYGPDASLNLDTSPGGGFRASLRLPLPEARP
jgi:hypothetical protein